MFNIHSVSMQSLNDHINMVITKKVSQLPCRERGRTHHGHITVGTLSTDGSIREKMEKDMTLANLSRNGRVGKKIQLRPNTDI